MQITKVVSQGSMGSMEWVVALASPLELGTRTTTGGCRYWQREVTLCFSLVGTSTSGAAAKLGLRGPRPAALRLCAPCRWLLAATTCQALRLTVCTTASITPQKLCPLPSGKTSKLKITIVMIVSYHILERPARSMPMPAFHSLAMCPE